MYAGSLKKVEVNGACPICLEDMNEPTKIVITKCNHAFHEKCVTFHLNIDEATRKKCPYCRQMPTPMVRAEEPFGEVEKNAYIECKMLRALRDGDLGYVCEALLAKPYLTEQVYINKDNNMRYPLLTLAAMFGHQDLIVFLLRKVKEESIDRFSSDGLSALSAACLFGHTQIAKLLLNAGAKVNNINSDGKNALWFAASAGKKELMELLVKAGSTVTNKSKENFTPLFIATQKGHLEIVDYLISVIPKAELKEHVNVASSTLAATALFMAAQAGNTNVVSSLLLAGADPHQALSRGQIPLHIATINGHFDVIKILIEKGTCVNYKGSNGATALGYAAAKGHREICEYLLLKAKADPTLGCEDGIFKRQVSPAEIARSNTHVELANYLADYAENHQH